MARWILLIFSFCLFSCDNSIYKKVSKNQNIYIGKTVVELKNMLDKEIKCNNLYCEIHEHNDFIYFYEVYFNLQNNIVVSVEVNADSYF